MFIFHLSSETRTRGHMSYLVFYVRLQSCRHNAGKFSFSLRAVSEWNSLPPKAVNETMINGFKNIIDSIFRKRRGQHISQNRLSAPVLNTPYQCSSLMGSNELSYALYKNLSILLQFAFLFILYILFIYIQSHPSFKYVHCICPFDTIFY